MASRAYVGELYDKSKSDLAAILAKHADADQQERVDFLRAARMGSAPDKALLQGAFLAEMCAILASIVDRQAEQIKALQKAGK